MTIPLRVLDDDGASRERLQHVAGLLAGVGNADPRLVGPGVALLCLAAAERLRPVVGQPARTSVDGARVGDAVGQALATLAALPERVFAVEAVLDAAADVRRARDLLA
jgi:hypothetical protein